MNNGDIGEIDPLRWCADDAAMASFRRACAIEERPQHMMRRDRLGPWRRLALSLFAGVSPGASYWALFIRRSACAGPRGAGNSTSPVMAFGAHSQSSPRADLGSGRERIGSGVLVFSVGGVLVSIARGRIGLGGAFRHAGALALPAAPSSSERGVGGAVVSDGMGPPQRLRPSRDDAAKRTFRCSERACGGLAGFGFNRAARAGDARRLASQYLWAAATLAMWTLIDRFAAAGSRDRAATR